MSITVVVSAASSAASATSSARASRRVRTATTKGVPVNSAAARLPTQGRHLAGDRTATAALTRRVDVTTRRGATNGGKAREWTRRASVKRYTVIHHDYP
jgi:hypothetical protein